MTRSRRTAAVSAVVMSLGLTGAALLAVAPLTTTTPADAAIRLVLASPSEIPGCYADPAAPCEEQPAPAVTVTVTQYPEEPPAPQKTVTTTITVPPSKPPKTTAPAPAPTPTLTPPPPVIVEPPPVVTAEPTQDVTAEPTPEESEVVFPSTEQSPTEIPTASPVPSGTPAFEDVTPDPVPYEIRNAGSEFDGATLSSQLAIPALILVLLVLFSVLIFEGRLRRLAHAAAIRHAGPRVPGRQHGEFMGATGYPAGPGYGPAPGFQHGVYPGGTAYAPIISLVPMQMYPSVYPESHAPEWYPQPYEQMSQPGYEQAPQPGYEPEWYPQTHEQPFHQGHEQAPQPGYEPERYSPTYGQPPYGPIGDGPQAPLPDGDVPPAAPGQPFPQGPGEFPGAPLLRESQGPPYAGGHAEETFIGPPPPPGPDSTAIQPLPGQDAGKRRRGLFRRST
ncbi:hypothetical protein [Streptosporangium sp. NPDC087985]|uniref:hypothetical protein n=1 Tax=Streptosporangium sp. NPDC087985 TaxID=3366196 RepID=UPI0037FE65F3